MLQSQGLLNANYNEQTGRATVDSIPIASRRGVTLSCDNCYAYLQAGVRFSIVIQAMAVAPFVYIESMQVGTARITSV